MSFITAPVNRNVRKPESESSQEVVTERSRDCRDRSSDVTGIRSHIGGAIQLRDAEVPERFGPLVAEQLRDAHLDQLFHEFSGEGHVDCKAKSAF